MNVLYGWTVKRSANTMSVAHSTGKLTGVESITLTANGDIVAVTAGRKFKLSTEVPETRFASQLKASVGQ